MGFISDAIGAKNNYNATATTNGVQGQVAPTTTRSYDPGFAAAQQQFTNGAAGFNATQGQLGALSSAMQGQAGQLQQAASGVGPSLAQMQLQQATDQNVNQAAGTIASQKGIDPGLGARLVAQNQAGIQQQAAGQSAMTQLAQQQAAQQQLSNFRQAQGQILGQQQQGALSLAGLGNQLYGTSAGAMNAQNQGIIQNSLGAQGITAQGKIANQQAQTAASGINSGVAQANANTNGAIAGGLIGGAAQGAEAAFIPKAHGGPVGGQPLVPGDSPKNDVVPIMASPEEIVLPRSVTMAKNAPDAAKKFVTDILAGKKGKDEAETPEQDEKAQAFMKAIKAKKRAA